MGTSARTRPGGGLESPSEPGRMALSRCPAPGDRGAWQL